MAQRPTPNVSGSNTNTDDAQQNGISDERRRAFAEKIAHDLRGPLASIRGFAVLMKEEDLTKAERDEFLDTIVESAEQTLLLTNAVLDFALLADHTTLHFEEIDLKQIIMDAANDLRGAARSKAVHVRLKVSGEEATIQGDLTRIHRSVWNLIDNAIRHSPDNSTVWCELSFSRTTATITIRDESPGIPEEEIDHVFEKFYQLDGASKKSVGKGLGLALVMATAAAHNGEASVHNVDGAGAEFRLVLPVDSAPRTVGV